MQLTISGKDFALTPSIKTYVASKLSRLEKFAHDAERIGVELDVDHSHHKGDIYRIEVWVYFPGETIQAGEKAEDMHAAVDLVYPKLERQLTDRKQKKLAERKG